MLSGDYKDSLRQNKSDHTGHVDRNLIIGTSTHALALCGVLNMFYDTIYTIDWNHVLWAQRGTLCQRLARLPVGNFKESYSLTRSGFVFGSNIASS